MRIAAALLAAVAFAAPALAQSRPNVILVMSDDQGFGDTGYNGHPKIETPALDAIAASGVRFDRWYSAAPVCSPTRGSCLTGRHPYRYKIRSANRGHMPAQETTLAEAVKKLGYRTGHFGKWHLGTLTKTGRDSNRGGARNLEHYAPPWENGFDVCFSTEAKVPTWNPMVTPERAAGGVNKRQTPGQPYGTAYWTGPGQKVTDNLEGDDSRIIMDRAIPFIEAAAKAGDPFLAVIWFHAPHLPVVAGPKYLARYEGLAGRLPHYYGCLTALDEQVGRLRTKLRELGIAKDTMLWFSSDNGPEGRDTAPGRTGGLRGRKRSLYEGGIRVPGLLEWPGHITEPKTIDVPCVTSDYLPTILAVLGEKPPAGRPIDGIDLLPILDGKLHERPRPLAFESSNQQCLIEKRWKLIKVGRRRRRGGGSGKFELYDLLADPGETNDVAEDHPEVVARMTKTLAQWRESCAHSAAGGDYESGGK